MKQQHDQRSHWTFCRQYNLCVTAKNPHSFFDCIVSNILYPEKNYDDRFIDTKRKSSSVSLPLLWKISTIDSYFLSTHRGFVWTLTWATFSLYWPIMRGEICYRCLFPFAKLIFVWGIKYSRISTHYFIRFQRAHFTVWYRDSEHRTVKFTLNKRKTLCITTGKLKVKKNSDLRNLKWRRKKWCKNHKRYRIFFGLIAHYSSLVSIDKSLIMWKNLDSIQDWINPFYVSSLFCIFAQFHQRIE